MDRQNFFDPRPAFTCCQPKKKKGSRVTNAASCTNDEHRAGFGANAKIIILS